MHQLIRVIVPGTNQQDAVSRAHSALDSLVGIRFDSIPVFDYYRTFEEPDARFKQYVANVINDIDSDSIDDESVAAAYQIASDDGQALLTDAQENQSEEFRKIFAKLQAKLDDGLTVDDVMNDVKGARFDLQRLAEYTGPSIYLYDEHGSGLWSPNEVSDHVDRLQDSSLTSNGDAVVGADKPETDSNDGGRQASQAWLVPADVHY